MILAKLSGESVYNMSLGGYGPIQYLYLLQNLAVKLRPKTVIVGFYFAERPLRRLYCGSL